MVRSDDTGPWGAASHLQLLRTIEEDIKRSIDNLKPEENSWARCTDVLRFPVSP